MSVEPQPARTDLPIAYRVARQDQPKPVGGAIPTAPMAAKWTDRWWIQLSCSGVPCGNWSSIRSNSVGSFGCGLDAQEMLFAHAVLQLELEPIALRTKGSIPSY